MAIIANASLALHVLSKKWVIYFFSGVFDRRLLLLVPLEKLTPLPFTHFTHPVLRDVWKGSYVIKVFLGVKVVRLPRFGDRQTERLGQPAQREGKEGHAVQKHEVFHSHTHDFETVHNQVRFLFQKYSFIQDEVKVECLGVVCYSDYLIGTRARFR